MIKIIQKHVRNTSPRSLPIWRQHLDNLAVYQKRHIDTFLKAPGYESGAVKLLRYILNFIDYRQLDNYDNDFTRYTDYISHIRADVNNIFDPVDNGRGYMNCFIFRSRNYDTLEYILPVDEFDHIKHLPMEQPFSAWKDLKPVTMWTHDSKEFCQNILEDRIKFRYIQPNYAVIFVDVVTLCFMFYKFLLGRKVEDIQFTARVFIHEYVIKNLYHDVLNIWITQQFREIINCDTKDELNFFTERNLSSTNMETRYGYVGGRYKQATEELWDTVELVKNGNMTVSSLLSSPIYPNGSVLDRIDWSLSHLPIPDLRQYKYAELLRDIDYLELVLDLYGHIPNPNTVQALLREMRMAMRKAVTARYENSIRNRIIKVQFEDRFQALHQHIMRFNI